ncbi:MAG: hypothetical protein V1901_04280 [Patescibacteria group bacterium]
MFCLYTQSDKFCSGTCQSGCPYGFEFGSYTKIEFNYECPDCKGKFNSPAIPAVTSSIVYKCPFCGRIMKGI